MLFKMLFSAMDPCGLGLLSDRLRPVIRIHMVFRVALASPIAGLRFPPRRLRET